MKKLCEDLAAEGQALDDIVANLGDDEWHAVTPFYEWTVKDEIAHIAYFDWLAKISITDPKACDAEISRLKRDVGNLFQETLTPGRGKTNAALLQWWREERKALNEVYLSCDPKQRLPWWIPMSAQSSATARLMETWAHGQDIVDALQVKRRPTDRLQHIAHLGVSTFGWSFRVRGLDPPVEPVRCELLSPSNDLWTWGPEGAADKIRGTAEDFCLVVSQRRHFKDTHLEVTGETTEKWMTVAQVFAGPPAQGPPPGTFRR